MEMINHQHVLLKNLINLVIPARISTCSPWGQPFTQTVCQEYGMLQ